MSKRLPDLPGVISGIVGRELDELGGIKYTLQCEKCFNLETPVRLILMSFKFHNRNNDPRRLCPDCRRALYPTCNCNLCERDRKDAAR